MSDHRGWECPRCGNVNSPNMDQCNCTVKKVVTKKKIRKESKGGSSRKQLLTE